MASLIDPITGLPYDALDSTIYSIPLDSQPALAPEWSPQGRISSTVYPDNIPTVFATAQAQNETNPKIPQALTTDGQGNLNVNVKMGGGGGGGGGGMSCSSSQLFVQGAEGLITFPFAGVQPLVWDMSSTAGPYTLDPLDQSKIILHTGGLYLFTGQVYFTPTGSGGFPDVTGALEIDIYVNGALVNLPFSTFPVNLPQTPKGAFNDITIPLVGTVIASAGDVIQVMISSTGHCSAGGAYTWMVASLL